MLQRISYIILLVFIGQMGVMAQSKIAEAKKNYVPGFESPPAHVRLRNPILHAGAGMMFYLGSIKSPANYQRHIGIRAAANLGVEKRFGKVAGVMFNFMYGQVAGEKRSVSDFSNFESRLLTADLRFTLNFDYAWFGTRMIAPYIQFGAGYMNFLTRSDLLDANGNRYYLWDDGVLRDQAQNGTVQGIPKVLKRDYRYETDITPAQRNTLIIPLAAGFKFKMHDFWDFNLGFTYFYTISKFMGSAVTKNNDGYGYLNFGFAYHFGKSEAGKEELRQFREKYKNAK